MLDDTDVRASGAGGWLMKRRGKRRCNRGTLHLRSSQTREVTSKGVRQFGAVARVSPYQRPRNRPRC
jgi:hypothetical protein